MVFGSAAAVTADIQVEWVKLDGDEIDINDDNIKIELGEEIPLRVKLQAGNISAENVEVLARIVGYEYSSNEGSLIDVYGPFDLDPYDTETVDLDLMIPIRADKDEYELVIDVSDRRNEYTENRYTLRVKGPRTGIRISDVIFSPGGSVEAGRALLVQARLENLGERDLDDVKVTAEIPALGLEGSVFLDQELDGDDFGRPDVEVSEEILLRIPQCAEEGAYTVRITAEFDEYEEASVLEDIFVYASGSCQVDGGHTPDNPAPIVDRTVVTPPQAQNVNIGQGGASYPVVVTNLGSSSRSYVVAVTGTTGWGVAEVSEPAFVVPAGDSKIVYVFVSADPNADAGQRVFNIAVNEESFPVVANLVEAEQSSWSGVTRALEIGLIILVIILIILGLIVGFSRLRGDDRDDEGKTYY